MASDCGSQLPWQITGPAHQLAESIVCPLFLPATFDLNKTKQNVVLLLRGETLCVLLQLELLSDADEFSYAHPLGLFLSLHNLDNDWSPNYVAICTATVCSDSLHSRFHSEYGLVAAQLVMRQVQ